eukprot:10301743-Lingulodinium_polyedra.AAC.1
MRRRVDEAKTDHHVLVAKLKSPLCLHMSRMARSPCSCGRFCAEGEYQAARVPRPIILVNSRLASFCLAL